MNDSKQLESVKILAKAKKLQLMSGLGWRSGAGSIVSHHADHSLECKLVAI